MISKTEPAASGRELGVSGRSPALEVYAKKNLEMDRHRGGVTADIQPFAPLAPFLSLGLALFACCDRSGAGPVADAGPSTMPPGTSSAASAVQAPIANAGPIVQRSAPKAPARASALACAPPKPGVRRYYPHDYNGRGCIMRGGRSKVVDSEALKAAGRHPVTLCEDDDCTTDSHCGADRVCACAPKDSEIPEEHNRCIFGNCTSDADCEGFACAEALALGIPSVRV